MPRMSAVPTLDDLTRSAFYRAGVLGLRALDARERTPRRLGRDADLRWERFSGGLDAADRVDLLLRDAAVVWKVAFSPAETFGLPGLATDEPFGPDWQSLPAQEAKRLLAEPTDPVDLRAVAAALGISPVASLIPPLTDRSRVLVIGGAAVLAMAEHAQAHPTLSWSDQVAVVAQAPGARQLAGLAAVLLGATSATRILWPTPDGRAVLASLGWPRVDHVVAGADLTDDEQALARALRGS